MSQTSQWSTFLLRYHWKSFSMWMSLTAVEAGKHDLDVCPNEQMRFQGSANGFCDSTLKIVEGPVCE